MAVVWFGFSIRASFGVFQIPIAEEFGWLRYEFSLAIAIQNLAVLVVLPMLRTQKAAPKAELEESLGEVLVKALRDPTYGMIFFGFFSCGFQLAFMTAHFPAFVTEVCIGIGADSLLRDIGVDSTSALGAFAIALIGAANIVGTIAAGALGKKWSKKYLLTWIYTGRTIVAIVFIMLPMTPLTVVVFSIAMGALWLATVPLTSGLIAHIYGLKYMGTLFGIVFFSHQLGAFLGVWLGGVMYDLYGSYDMVWWVGIGVGAFSAIIHLPIREKPMETLAAAE